MIPKEIFLSHSSENQEIADCVAETLRNHGVPVWFSPSNIMSATQWHEEIGRALRRCDWFLVLLSKASIKSKWVKLELSYALNHSQFDDHILPVTIEKCKYEDLSWTLGVFQMVSLGSKKEAGFTKILNAWGMGFDSHKMSSGDSPAS